jgi:prevent-host-death family protein
VTRWSIDVEDTVSATEARVRFGELMRRAVETGQAVIVKRGGKAHVVVLSMEAYQRLLKGQRQKDWQELVAQARTQIQADLAGRQLPRSEDVVRQTREERYGQLVDLLDTLKPRPDGA